MRLYERRTVAVERTPDWQSLLVNGAKALRRMYVRLKIDKKVICGGCRKEITEDNMIIACVPKVGNVKLHERCADPNVKIFIPTPKNLKK